MNDSEMSLDKLCAKIVSREMEISELGEDNRNLLELAKMLINHIVMADVFFWTDDFQDKAKKINKYVLNNYFDNEAAGKALTEISDRLSKEIADER